MNLAPNLGFTLATMLRLFTRRFALALLLVCGIVSTAVLLAQAAQSPGASSGSSNGPPDGEPLEVHEGQRPENPLASETSIPKRRDAEAHDALLNYSLTMEPSDLERRIVIATGPNRGGYYGVGGVICALINRSYPRHRIECLVRPSTGSRENLVLVRRGQADLAIVQSDLLAYAARGDLPILAEGESFDRLRGLASLYPIPAHLLVRDEASVRSIEDLTGKRVALGPAGSAQRTIAAAVLTQAGINLRALENVSESEHADPVAALCNGTVDAVAIVSPVPHPSLMVATARCGVSFLPLESEALSEMVAANPFFIETPITAASYNQLERDIPTIGFAAVLTARDDLETRVVAEALNAIAANFSEYQAAYPALSAATPACLAQCGIAVPLHNGVTEYLTLFGETVLPEALIDPPDNLENAYED